MDIRRKDMMVQMEAFATRDNGIVVGLPGVGKTHSFRELSSIFRSSGRTCVPIRVDRLDAETESDLMATMRINGDLINYLRKLIPPDCPDKCVLLIDAFDAARSERAERTLMGIIRAVRMELADSWNVVVSVRTYDAKKSHELQELFPARADNAPASSFQLTGIECRHFAIPLLTDDEVFTAVEKMSGSTEIYETGSDDFKELLRIPFNLWLVERLLYEDADIPGLTSVASEVQLLGLFWKYRVRHGLKRDGKTVLLTKIARALVQRKSLSVRKEEVFDPASEEAWTSLLSSDVLCDAELSEQRVSFSHNILFDYAVSVLLIEDDPDRLLEFISADPSRPLFLRPSLVYHLTRLWHDAPEVFWNICRRLIPLRNDPHVHLFARLLPPGVIANEARSLEELRPLLDDLQRLPEYAPCAVLRLLQAIRMMEVERDPLWISFLDGVTTRIDGLFVWDVTRLATEIAGRTTPDNENTTWTIVGRLSRKLADWFWAEMDRPGTDTSKNPGLVSIGEWWILPLVAKTYSTDIADSRAILGRVLSLLGREGFPIGLLQAVTKGIGSIYPFDPCFAAEVYDKTFDYCETSNETTDMGGRVLRLSSTRRQDYEMCRYMLIEKFFQFLRSSPVIATECFITLLSKYVLRRHVVGNLNEGFTVEDLMDEFCFNGNTVTYVNDLSSIWDSMSHVDGPIEMADVFFDYIAELAELPEGREQLHSVIGVFGDKARVAFLWRRLLSTAARFPEVFSGLLLDLCLAHSLQVGGDTVYQFGEFLEAVAHGLSPDQLLSIEESIMAIPSEVQSRDAEYLFGCRDRHLARIPRELLQTPEGKRVREDMEKANQVPENRPPFTSSGFEWQEYTEEMSLEDRDVDVNKPEHQALLTSGKLLDGFNTKWLNGKPQLDSLADVFAVAIDAYALLKSAQAADEPVVESLTTKLGRFAQIASRVVDALNEEQFDLCREWLLVCAEHPSPKPDLPNDFNSPSWSPSPRIEAAGGVPLLAAHDPDRELLEAVCKLAQDEVPAVRFLVSRELGRIFPKSPGTFWDIVEDRVKVERNQFVAQSLLHSLSFVVADHETRAVAALGHLSDSMLVDVENASGKASSDNGFTRDIMPIVVWLVLKRGNKWAEGFVERLLAHPVCFAGSINELNSAALDCVFRADQAISSEIVNSALGLVERTISAASSGIAELHNTAQGQWDDELLFKLRATYDVLDGTVRRIFFALRSDTTRGLQGVPKQHEELARLYPLIQPLLQQILDFAADQTRGVMFASTAHAFMQILNQFLDRNRVAMVLHMAGQVVRSGKGDEYHLDPMAITEVVKLVEAVLADHRDVVRDGEPLSDLLNLLDTFAAIGSPEALRLVWRLDEVFR